jgi:hypothetical protein
MSMSFDRVLSLYMSSILFQNRGAVGLIAFSHL